MLDYIYVRSILCQVYSGIKIANRLITIQGINIFALSYAHNHHQALQVPEDADIIICTGDSVILQRITAILKNHFGYTDRSHFFIHTYSNVHYFKKAPMFERPKLLES